MPRPKKFPSEKVPIKTVGAYLRKVAEIRRGWKELRDEVTSRGDIKSLWFRGQGDAAWGLTPSRWRPGYAEETEAEMRLEFESVGRQLAPTDAQRDKWGWYFLMAHYEAPTRLLDFTVNPMVALYFAVKSAMPGVDAAVWVLDPWKWNEIHVRGLYGPALPGWKETKPYLWDLEDSMDVDNTDVRRKWPVAIEPPHIDRRISAQEGRFMLFGTERDMVRSPNVNRRTKKGKHAKLDKIAVASSSVKAIRDELDCLSVNDKTLFPDLGGLAKYIAWKWKHF